LVRNNQGFVGSSAWQSNPPKQDKDTSESLHPEIGIPPPTPKAMADGVHGQGRGLLRRRMKIANLILITPFLNL
jgi:hypothetical protein